MMETPEYGESSEKTHGATNQTKLSLHGHLQIILIIASYFQNGGNGG